MMYGYARCSTNEDKQDIDRQRRELKKLGVNDSEIFFEYESGSKEDRIQLNRLLDLVQSGDTIATTEVSRLTRSTKQLCGIIALAKKKRLKLIIGTFKVDCRTELDPMTQGMIMMWGVFSEMERNITSQRVKSGMANAKEKGAKIGRPARTIDNLPTSFLKHYHLYASKEISQEKFALLCGLTRQTIAKYIRVYNKAYDDIVDKEIQAEARAEAKKEEKRLQSFKRMTYEELEDLAKKEELTIGVDGVSAQWTPATKELERRKRKRLKAQEEYETPLDLSEFDI